MANLNVQVLEEIIWAPTPPLHPGMDFKDGITYFTVPLKRRVIVPTKKKGEDAKVEAVDSTYVITSEHEGIWYEDEALEDRGWSAKKAIYQDDEQRWSNESVRAFLENKTKAPSSQDLFKEIRGIYTKYVEFADEAFFDIMTLFVMYSYIYRLFKTTGYIHFNGTAASGKSRNLSILNALAFGAVWASSMSAASLYRRLDGSPGTTCIDESEGFEGERGEDLRRILNAGYIEGATVQRTEKTTTNGQERWHPVKYEVFSPKVMASINPLEPVIASRCIVVAMRPAVRQLPDFRTYDKQWAPVRDRLYLWAMENATAIEELNETWDDTSENGVKAERAPRVIGRQWETTRQYIVLSDYIGGQDMSDRMITFLNSYFKKQQEGMDATDRIRTSLRCLPRVLDTMTAYPGNMYSVKDIHEVISSYMETDSTEYFKTKHVTKNLDVLGFRQKIRASGGLQIRLDEDAVRNEFAQRRVEPFEEDMAWLSGEVNYQGRATLFDGPTTTKEGDPEAPWWEQS